MFCRHAQRPLFVCKETADSAFETCGLDGNKDMCAGVYGRSAAVHCREFHATAPASMARGKAKTIVVKLLSTAGTGYVPPRCTARTMTATSCTAAARSWCS